MITAKQAYNSTDIFRYLQEKIEEIEMHIQVAAQQGRAYTIYSGVLPESIRSMLAELGYAVESTENASVFSKSEAYLISWAKVDGTKRFTCN